MDPSRLCNEVFWYEPLVYYPERITPTNDPYDYIRWPNHQQLNEIDEIRRINRDHKCKLNGEFSSRTPLIIPQEKSNSGKRFKRC
jgi:hypothetical protein